MTRSALSLAVLGAILSDSQYAWGTASSITSVLVEDIRIGLAQEKTRLVFDLSGPASFDVSVLENPARIQVDLNGGHSRVDPAQLPLQGTPIRAVTAHEDTGNTLTYVFDVDPGTDSKAFALKPFEGRQHRLVIDLYASNQNTIGSDSAGNVGSQPSSIPHRNERQTQRDTPLPTTIYSGPPEPREYSGEWSGFVSIDARLFFQSPEYPEQKDQNVSLAFKPEYYVDWADGTQQFGFSPFFRYDAQDKQRTHADIRELYWQLERERVITKVGVDVVFWGVTESQHLVDIINQTDLVENIDGEEKLGQPMLNVDYLSDWGSWQGYVLPYFRERTFPGEHGRLRSEPAVSTSNPLYEAGSEEKHVDFALRWSHHIGDWDLGLAHFTGTGREPYLQADTSSGGLRLVPYYLQIDQTSLDAQATKGAWLWKLEAIYNQNTVEDYYAYVGGFEHTTFGVRGSPVDLGLLLEYHDDERGDEATNGLASDIYLGLRLTANDVASSMALAGIIYDTDTQSVFGNIEASRRLNENWSMDLELRFTTNPDEDENLYFIESDDYLGIALRRYF
jgi:AMIN domain